MLHISNHHTDKYLRSTDRNKLQLEDKCQKRKKRTCRVTDKKDRRPGSHHQQLTEESTAVSDKQSLLKTQTTTLTLQNQKFGKHHKKGVTISEAG